MSQISKKQDGLIEQLLTQPSISAAAEAVKVNRRTAARWLADPTFRQRLREAKTQALDRALARICYSASEAADILVKGMAGQTITRMQYWCAKTTLEVAALAREKDFEERVSDLERRIRERQNPAAGYTAWSDQQLEARLGELQRQTLKDFSADELRERLRQIDGNGDGDRAPSPEQMRKLRERLFPPE